MLDAARDNEVLAEVQAAAKGDGDAYARLIRRYQPALNRRMRRFAHSQADVEELVQQVFIEAYFSLSTFRGSAEFEHWLQRIATRVGHRYWKREKKRRNDRPLELAEAVAAVESGSIGAEEARETLGKVMDRLAPRDRLVITLLHIEGRSVEEAADLTGWSQTMVKVQAFRARGKLRRLIQEA